MRIRWTPAAAADLRYISDYLKDRHPAYRQPTMRKLYQAIRSLRNGRIAATPARIVPESSCFHRCLTSRCTG
jgi:plasmid stabilization system protein ParE